MLVLSGGMEKNKQNGEASDKYYFEAYADIDVHEEMLGDRKRTMAYKRAILQNYDRIYGKVVIDVGAGTGILSMFCVLAGAKKVYAIEASDMVHQMRKLIADNKMENRIEIVHGQVEIVDIPEKADVIVSEWMGYCLLYESMLSSVLIARDKWLKPNGLLLPNKAQVFISLYSESTSERAKQIEFWRGLKDTYKIDMSGMSAYASECFTRRVHLLEVLPEDIVSHACKVISIDLQTVNVNDCSNFTGQFTLECFGQCSLSGFALWFNVDFEKDISLTTSPYSEPTHWLQTVLYFDCEEEAEQGTRYEGQLSLAPMKQCRRFLDIDIAYRSGDTNSKQILKHWHMDSNL